MTDISSGYCTKTYSGHDLWVRRVVVSPDSTLLASVSVDKTLRLWNIKSGECVRTGRDHDHVVECVAFSTANADLYIANMVHASRHTRTGAAHRIALARPADPSPFVLAADRRRERAAHTARRSADGCEALRVQRIDCFDGECSGEGRQIRGR